MLKRLMALLVVSAFLVVACGGDTAVLETVDPATADTLISGSDTVLLDIRTPEEFAEARIEGAINIDFYADDFAAMIGELDRDASYVVYCRSDNRSGQAMDLFRDLDFAEVREIDGGIVAWMEAGLPTVTG
jgi:phage shock protein E